MSGRPGQEVSRRRPLAGDGRADAWRDADCSCGLRAADRMGSHWWASPPWRRQRKFRQPPPPRAPSTRTGQTPPRTQPMCRPRQPARADHRAGRARDGRDRYPSRHQQHALGLDLQRHRAPGEWSASGSAKWPRCLPGTTRKAGSPTTSIPTRRQGQAARRRSTMSTWMRRRFLFKVLNPDLGVYY